MTSSLPPPSAGSPPNTRLNGWKEIATHLGRGVRTVQRWEKTFGMPVHRIGTGRGENVHAFSEELDAWLATAARSRDLRDQPGDGTAAEPDPPSNDSGFTTPETHQPQPPARSTAVRQVAWLVLAAVGLAAGAAALWLALRPGAVPVPPPAVADPRRQPSTAKADGETLLVSDAENRFLWRRQFDGPLPFKGEGPATGLGRRVRVMDVNGDGVREVLVFAHGPGSQSPDTLYCLDAGGKTLWTRTSKDSVRFGDTHYSPPWEGRWLFVTGTSRAPVLWAVWIHLTSGFFPCLVERLSGQDGRPLSQYWSAGYVEAVVDAAVQGRPSVLVGAANNDHVGASLAVFDVESVTGSAPAESPDKVCNSCGPGGPRAFLVFPQLELSRLTNGNPSVFDVRAADNGELSVWVIHQGPEGMGAASYRLDPDLRPVSAELGADYRAVHEALEAAGRLKHRLSDRDHAELFPVLVYEGTRFVKVWGRITR